MMTRYARTDLSACCRTKPAMNPTIRKMMVEDLPAVVELDQKSFSLPWPERSFRLS